MWATGSTSKDGNHISKHPGFRFDLLTLVSNSLGFVGLVNMYCVGTFCQSFASCSSSDYWEVAYLWACSEKGTSPPNPQGLSRLGACLGQKNI